MIASALVIIVYLIVPGMSNPFGTGPPAGIQKRPSMFWVPLLRKMDTCKNVNEVEYEHCIRKVNR